MNKALGGVLLCVIELDINKMVLWCTFFEQVMKNNCLLICIAMKETFPTP